MLSAIRKKKSEGFTIIEVLIVLAIAGLIMLIVFLAVPALQRNARNTQRRNDIGNILSGVAEFSNDNEGTLPSTSPLLIAADGTTTFQAGGTTTDVNGAKLGFYKTGSVTFATVAAANTAPASPTDKAFIVTGATCSGNKAIAGTARSVVVTFWIEPGAATEQCQGS